MTLSEYSRRLIPYARAMPRFTCPSCGGHSWVSISETQRSCAAMLPGCPCWDKADDALYGIDSNYFPGQGRQEIK